MSGALMPMEVEAAKHSSVSGLKEAAARIAANVLRPNAEHIDREAEWPAKGLRALADAGLAGLHVPRKFGGLDQGLLALAVVSEELGAACGSTAMCFGMHCVATKVLAAKATPSQAQRYLKPIAEGRHFTTLALSEPETGAHFYLPRARIFSEGDEFRLEGCKSFVTSGGHADSYVISAVPPGRELDPGSFSCIVVDGETPGLQWQEAWRGLGMRGNSSRNVVLDDVRAPAENLLGSEGDELWYVFEVVAPYFLIAMSGVYLGIARAALDLAVGRLTHHKHEHARETLSANAALSDQVADLWLRIERARQLVQHAARLGDAGSAQAPQALFAAKIDVAETAVAVTGGALMLAGGRGYSDNGAIGRLLRDAQAAHVMSPTTHLLRSWLGHTILGLPLL
jgi:isovaleryl-CoA dehydrogenase